MCLNEKSFFNFSKAIDLSFYLLTVFFASLILIIFFTSSIAIVGAETIEIIRHDIDVDALKTKGELTADVALENFASVEKEIWLGYSFRDPHKRWHDIPSQNLQIGANSLEEIEIAEEIFSSDGFIPGEYVFVAAVWDAPPGDEATRLNDMRMRKTISPDSNNSGRGRDKSYDENLSLEFSGYEFLKATHRLGRGWLRPDNVSLENDIIKISSPDRSFQGGEIRTENYFSYGTYRIKMKTDYAPGSFSAFFLYEDVKNNNDEIDIEIYNDGSRKIDFVTFSEGEKTNHESLKLPFDPASDYHEYRIDYLPENISFYVEGDLLASFESDLPSADMRIMTNHWWPAWLEAEREHAASEIYIKEYNLEEF